MNIFEKIKSIYPQLKNEDFSTFGGTITLQNDGQNDYIKEWNNSLLQPTDEQLASIE